MKKVIIQTLVSCIAFVSVLLGFAQVDWLSVLLSSTAYNRSLESEADAEAVRYLMNAGINPKPFADFLRRLGEDESIPEVAVWISTHPDSKVRLEKVIDMFGGKHKAYNQILSTDEWNRLKTSIASIGKLF